MSMQPLINRDSLTSAQIAGGFHAQLLTIAQMHKFTITDCTSARLHTVSQFQKCTIAKCKLHNCTKIHNRTITLMHNISLLSNHTNAHNCTNAQMHTSN